jgi:hypothetical protein
MPSALMIPTPPAAKQPKTAQSNAVVLPELLFSASLCSTVSVWVVIKRLVIKPPNAECSGAGPNATENKRDSLPASAGTIR